MQVFLAEILPTIIIDSDQYWADNKYIPTFIEMIEKKENVVKKGKIKKGEQNNKLV
jgi:hypothetical protein